MRIRVITGSQQARTVLQFFPVVCDSGGTQVTADRGRTRYCCREPCSADLMILAKQTTQISNDIRSPLARMFCVARSRAVTACA